MKKILILSTILMLLLSGCVSTGILQDAKKRLSDEEEKTETTEQALANVPSEEDAIEGAKQLMNKVWQAVEAQDKEAFAKLFLGLDDETLSGEFANLSSYDIRQYDSQVFIPVASEESHYLINVVYYIVTGSHPNTHRDSCNFTIPFSYVQGEWMLDYRAETMDRLNDIVYQDQKIMPDECRKADMSGRNASFFGDYMYLDSSLTYIGSLDMEVKHAWQDEEGNLMISFWISNGTSENRYINYCNLQLTDSAIGEIVNLSGIDINLPVKSMSSRQYQIEIPADQVKTGTQTWSDISSYVDFNHA